MEVVDVQTEKKGPPFRGATRGTPQTLNMVTTVFTLVRQ